MAPLIKNPIIRFSLFGIASLFLLWQLIHLSAKAIFPTDDFVGFWASSKLVLSGGNPYSAEALFLLQKAEGWK
jgi:hypothetical protein